MIARFFLAAMLIGLLSSCQNESKDFETQVQALAKKNIGQIITIDHLVSSKWDEFAVFGAYFPKEQACKIMELSTWACFWLPYTKPEDGAPYLIAFINKKSIVQTSFVNHCIVRLIGNEALKNKYKRRDGKFKVQQAYGECTSPPFVLIQQ